MNKKTLLKLEYNKIIDLLTEQASSFSGKERCRRLKPKTNLAEITLMQEETAVCIYQNRQKGTTFFRRIESGR